MQGKEIVLKVPKGYQHVLGNWQTGFVIENKRDGSRFVWITVEMLGANGTLDGIHFTEKFGRRIFQGETFSEEEYHEEIDPEMLASIKKYGGFYISVYPASRSKDGNFLSNAGKTPWVSINFYDAKKVAENYAKDSADVKSCLPCGAAYDCINEWIIETGAKTREELVKDSTNCGNFYNSPNALYRLAKTGENENWCVRNIHEWIGNTDEWTTEQYGWSHRVVRGGTFLNYGYDWPAASRYYFKPDDNYVDTSFRTLLWLK